MAQARTTAACVVVDGSVYVMGGFNGEEWLKTVEMFQPEAGWSEVRPMTTSRSMLCAAVLQG
eukprot:CAMPEP_0173437800 /NCGR_PEP_ID=MMETSP1357-20121228/18422_1 /TAXON_ID=77926 /ORGANISM="Hemiselmis rufescens, Strain PCC563" /LENGTH=61 /DNA_ID=CAMNT_0014403003 /DNA_START=89 /DNA_END=274 /DNA_ORIENTATION=-